MHFGELVRDVLSASCGVDLRAARATRRLPELDDPGAMRTIAADLESAFCIEIADEDLPHLRTIRDVLQCVRLRLWERRAAARALGAALPADAGRPAARIATQHIHPRLVRCAPQAPVLPPAVSGGRSGTRL